VLFFDDVEVIVPNPKFVLNNETKISCIDDFIMVIRLTTLKISSSGIKGLSSKNIRGYSAFEVTY